ncbi:hypothetical protein ACI3PL_28015, partial [Lacticaseibacillus paracasei]
VEAVNTPLLATMYVYPEPSTSFITKHEPFVVAESNHTVEVAVPDTVVPTVNNPVGVEVPTPTFPVEVATANRELTLLNKTSN